MAREESIEFFSGNDITLLVTILDGETGLPLNLVGASAIIWSLAKAAKNVPIITKALLDGIEVINPATGRVNVTLTAAEVEPLKGEYYHEMRLTNSDSKKATVLYGTVTIAENLVRN